MLGSSDDLAPALFRTILDVFPVLCPFLAPLESTTAASTDLWLEAVFGLRGWTHDSSLIRRGWFKRVRLSLQASR
jgi:hypothetical protein